MGYFRQNLRVLVWLASVAILLNALMPTIAHAIAASQGGPVFWGAICSASGTKFAPVPFGQPADNKSDSKAAMVHCPYCLAHAGSVALPSQQVQLSLTVALAHVMPRLFYLAPYPLHAWVTAHPRAPPSLV